VSPKQLAQSKPEALEYGAIFYKPHTLISLGILLATLYTLVESDALNNLAVAFSFSPDKTAAELSVKNDEYQRNGALIGTCIAFVAFGSIHLPNTMMTRPHPIVWRALLAMFTLYGFFMTYLFLLPAD
jgi:phosphatidylserine synthase 2